MSFYFPVSFSDARSLRSVCLCPCVLHFVSVCEALSCAQGLCVPPPSGVRVGVCRSRTPSVWSRGWGPGLATPMCTEDWGHTVLSLHPLPLRRALYRRVRDRPSGVPDCPSTRGGVVGLSVCQGTDRGGRTSSETDPGGRGGDPGVASVSVDHSLPNPPESRSPDRRRGPRGVTRSVSEGVRFWG